MSSIAEDLLTAAEAVTPEFERDRHAYQLIYTIICSLNDLWAMCYTDRTKTMNPLRIDSNLLALMQSIIDSIETLKY